MAREALGDDVVDHYLNYARTEQGLFDRSVTGYERSGCSSAANARRRSDIGVGTQYGASAVHGCHGSIDGARSVATCGD